MLQRITKKLRMIFLANEEIYDIRIGLLGAHKIGPKKFGATWCQLTSFLFYEGCRGCRGGGAASLKDHFSSKVVHLKRHYHTCQEKHCQSFVRSLIIHRLCSCLKNSLIDFIILQQWQWRANEIPPQVCN